MAQINSLGNNDKLDARFYEALSGTRRKFVSDIVAQLGLKETVKLAQFTGDDAERAKHEDPDNPRLRGPVFEERDVSTDTPKAVTEALLRDWYRTASDNERVDLVQRLEAVKDN